MATIHKEISITAPADEVWAAVRDVGAIHERLVPGLVADTQLEEGARVVTFANGLVIRERFVTIDDEKRRFAYSATGGNATHHNSSVQVFAEGKGSRLVWITDLLPDSVAPLVQGLVEQGSGIMKSTLERAALTPST
jgi:carbon monoxide dehydrogenase subunit G